MHRLEIFHKTEKERTGNQYRPMPFWSWNDRIEKKEIIRQIDEMAKQGIGGFVIHARSGLLTEYMSEEWLEDIETAIDRAEQHQMKVWIYDENGWPSGFGNGLVNGLGPAYQQKSLKMEPGEKHTDFTVANVDGYHFYYEINPYYVDTLDPKVTGRFIQMILKPYAERFGNRFEGFFTDEPQVNRGQIPWSFTLEAAYRKEYGRSLIPHLPDLFWDREDSKETRICFWRLVAKLFSRSYVKQISDWTHEHGLKLTGHLLLEENLLSQITTAGAVMPAYRYFDIPGADWLGEEKRDTISQSVYPLTFRQVGSVAQQYGKEAVLTETFAASGHEISFSEMRGLLEWQMVQGITIVCPHLQPYSTRGRRKRDFPPALFVQQPWWKDYHIQNDYLAEIGKLLSQGKPNVHTLVIHPEPSAWAGYAPGNETKVKELSDRFEAFIKTLAEHQIEFHLGDQISLEEDAYLEGKEICIGQEKYSRVYVTTDTILLPGVSKMLGEYQEAGGILIKNADTKIQPEDTPNGSVLFTSREYENGSLFYYVNPLPEKVTLMSVKGNYYLDANSLKWKKLRIPVSLEKDESILTACLNDKKDQWKIQKCDDNVMLLDTCDIEIDKEPKEKDGYVLNALEYALERGKKTQADVHVREVFHVKIRNLPKKAELGIEDPQQYKIAVNGRKVRFSDTGYFIDASIRKTDVTEYLIPGENEIELTLTVPWSRNFYESLEKAKVFESEKNKLTYPVETEAIYLIGPFGVYGQFEEEEEESGYCAMKPETYIGDFPEAIFLKDIEKQGFPFFAGTMTLTDIWDETPKTIKIRMDGIESAHVCINGREIGTAVTNHMELEADRPAEDTTQAVEAEITISNSLRNIWGPHHMKTAGRITAWPSAFYEKSELDDEAGGSWDRHYVLKKESVSVNYKRNR